MTEDDRKLITATDLWNIAFSKGTQVLTYKMENGNRLVKMRAKKEGTPFGDLHIWLLYNSNPDDVTTAQDELIEELHKSEGKIIIIDDCNPKKPSLLVEIGVLTDGNVSMNAIEMSFRQNNDGKETKGTIGWFIGQGYEFDQDEPGFDPVLMKIIGGTVEPFDRFTRFARREFEITLKNLEDNCGVKYEKADRSKRR
ncbi:MAG: hypothetical protein M0R06_00725 [Sphaerochaeta sp.]|jgi:hypothetical protein|nr:hypothetical protein [Sphaerochaeta sp.]